MFDFEATKSVADITRVQAAARPDGIAISFKDRTTTFARLDIIANQIAHALINLGVKPDDRVAVYGANSDHYLALFFGCVKARATLV
ncbi:MAG: AMP-binding protein, partial [Aquidulcibacter sp.]